MQKIWIADFETYIPKYRDIHDLKTKRTYVWGFAIADITNQQYVIGNTICEFIEIARQSDYIYFHNLKFDGQFIIDHLLRNGWEYDADLHENKKPKTFSILRSDRNVMYSMSLQYTPKHCTHIRDSLKKLPFTVKKLAQDYKLPIQKGKISYAKPRPEIYEMTDQEKEYIINDVGIVAEILSGMISEGHNHMTIGGDSLAEWKSTITKNQMSMLPEISAEIDKYIRKAYKGGFVWCNPMHQGKELPNGMVFDANSMHPTQMYYKGMPCGVPEYFEGQYEYDVTHPLYICRVILSAKLKPNSIPTISKVKSFTYVDAEYLTECDMLELTLTNIDLELIKDTYDISYIEYIDGFKFRKIKNLFKKFIDKWYDIKCHSKGSQRQLAKLLLNNLYGKFGTRLEQLSAEPYLDTEKNIVRYKRSDKVSTAKPMYLPIAIFTTAYSRDCVVRAAMPIVERVAYIDTDSLHIIGSEMPTHLNIDSQSLGAWDLEGKFTQAKFLRPKRYIEKTMNMKTHHIELNIKCGGMPENVKAMVTWDNFKVGSVFEGKLMPVVVEGGIVLNPTTYEMK